MKRTDPENLQARHACAVTRATWARVVTRYPGFWKWTQSYTHEVTKLIFDFLSVAFPPHCREIFGYNLQRAVNESIRIAIRMRCEYTIYDFTFPKGGIPWDENVMIHRNPELLGQHLSNYKSPWVVRCAALPVVKEKFFGDGTSKSTVLHRAELIVADRKTNLRPSKYVYKNHY